MKKLKRKPILLLMCLALLCTCIPTAGATGSSELLALPEQEVVQPMYQYTASTNTLLSISGSTATCKATLTGYSNTTTKVKIEMTLQKKSLLVWSDVTSWSLLVSNYKSTLTKTKSIASGTYRVKAVYTAYSGSASETFTKYSATVSL